MVRKMSFLREVLVRNRLSEICFQWASTRNCDLAYNRVCVSEHILNTDDFYHSKAFGYNLTFCFSFKPTSDLISEICKKAVAYWQNVLQCHLIRLILFLRNKKISIGALLPCFGTAERGGGSSVSRKVPEFQFRWLCSFEKFWKEDC